MVSFLYNLAWALFVSCAVPFVSLTRNRRLRERLGLGLPDIPRERKRIWVHALSVGEVFSALPLIRSIRLRFPSRLIALSVKTSQGMRMARKGAGGEADLIFPMPLDFWWSIGRVVHYVRPSILILMETDVWPGLLCYLKKRGIKVLLINGRISPKTFRNYRRSRFFARRMLNSLDMCLMQSDLDRGRLLDLGLSPEKAVTVGNIKFDRDRRPMDEKEKKYWFDLLNLSPEDRVWVAGSSHDGEEEILLEAYKRLRSFFTALRLIIAPRKIDRADDIQRLCRIKGITVRTRKDLGEDTADPWEVLILNTLGELGRIYGLAEISFVGGSLVPVGGHNLLEPAGFGCPVLFGIHTHNFVQMSQLLLDAGGGARVKDGDDLFKTMKGLLSDKEREDRMGSMAKEVVERNSGALRRVMDRIGGLIEAA